MPEEHTIRSFEGTEVDIDEMMRILRDSSRILEPGFVASGIGFERERWRLHIRDPQTEWILLVAPDGIVAGFAGWRFLPTMSHLHALFVAAAYQRRGYGRAMIHHHWQAVLERQADTQIVTLHVRQPATWAQELYLSEGYRFYQVGDEERWPALNVWIANCRQYDNWPLPAGKLLMFRRISQQQLLLPHRMPRLDFSVWTSQIEGVE